MPEDEIQFSRGQPEVDGNKYGPDSCGSKVEFDEFRAIVQDYRYAVPFFDAHVVKPTSGSIGTSMEIRVADALTLENESTLVRVEFSPSLDPPGNIHGSHHDPVTS